MVIQYETAVLRLNEEKDLFKPQTPSLTSNATRKSQKISKSGKYSKHTASW